ncbi:MAG: aldehyde dehydrogenase family protein, partial [Pedococcus sp.]
MSPASASPSASPRVLKNFVNGEYVQAQTDTRADIVSPVTGQVVATAPVSTLQDVDAAYAAASKAFLEWGQTTPSERQTALLKFADAIERRADEFVRLEAENTGKPHALTASEEMPPMVDQIRFFAGAARVLEGRAAGEYMRGHTSWIRREPIGVVGQVTPWNYPMMMATWKIAPALAAGNTVVLKPSDTTPETTLLMAEIASEFLPAGTFNVVTGDRDTGRAVVE